MQNNTFLKNYAIPLATDCQERQSEYNCVEHIVEHMNVVGSAKSEEESVAVICEIK